MSNNIFHFLISKRKKKESASWWYIKYFKKISCWQEDELTQGYNNKRSDAKELQSYYQFFYEKRIQDGENTKKP